MTGCDDSEPEAPTTRSGPVEWFRGTVWLDELAAAGGAGGPVALLKVRFAPGARTAWHRHPAGQVLHVLDGAGVVQDRGRPARPLRVGDTVVTAPEVWHWHGAAPSSFMTHLAAQAADAEGTTTVWGEHVSDADYAGGSEP